MNQMDPGQLGSWMRGEWCNCSRCGEVMEAALQIRPLATVGKPIPQWVELCERCLRDGLALIGGTEVPGG